MASEDLSSPKFVRRAGLVAGPAIGLAIAFLPLGIEPASARYAAAVASLMAAWWLTEALPITVTALVPLVAYPLLGVFPGGPLAGARESAEPYADGYIFLFMGGMALAAAMQECSLHRRIALTIMDRIGTEPKRLLLGFLVATAFLSLWISNTACAVMMTPIGMAVLSQYVAQEGRRPAAFGASVMMSIAYAANIGGIGTKIGTAPNAQFAGFVQQNLGIEVSFAKFLLIGMPFVIAMIPIAWWVLWRAGRSDAPAARSEEVARELARLGSMSRAEKIVLGFFLGAAALWIASGPITAWLAPAWPKVKAAVPVLGSLFPKLLSKHVEAGIALLAGFSLLAVPVGSGRRALTVAGLRGVPWSTLLLLGGGFAMAHGIEESGLSKWMAAKLGGMSALPLAGKMAVATFLTVAISAVASNTATIAVMLSVLRGVSTPSETAAVLAAATIASSCDFMLPAGTPPNAIVFGSGWVSIPRMARTGVVLDVVAAALAAAWGWIGLRHLF